MVQIQQLPQRQSIGGGMAQAQQIRASQEGLRQNQQQLDQQRQQVIQQGQQEQQKLHQEEAKQMMTMFNQGITSFAEKGDQPGLDAYYQSLKAAFGNSQNPLIKGMLSTIDNVKATPEGSFATTIPTELKEDNVYGVPAGTYTIKSNLNTAQVVEVEPVDRGKATFKIAFNKKSKQWEYADVTKGEKGFTGLQAEDPSKKGQKQLTALDLLEKFEKLPDVKAARVIETSVNKVNTLWENFLTNPAPETKNFLDQSLITIFNKLNDPTSVVRESEYARTPEGASLFKKWVGKYKKATTEGGAGLTDPDRQELVNISNQISDGQRESLKKRSDQFKTLGKEAGISDEGVNQAIKTFEQTFSPVSFDSIEDANAAGEAGKIQKGQRVVIGNEVFTWEE